MPDTAREIMSGGVDCIGENETMAQHEVKRVPVIDGHRLVGVVSESDVAASAPSELVVELVRGVYADRRGRTATATPKARSPRGDRAFGDGAGGWEGRGGAQTASGMGRRRSVV